MYFIYLNIWVRNQSDIYKIKTSLWLFKSKTRHLSDRNKEDYKKEKIFNCKLLFNFKWQILFEFFLWSLKQKD